MLVPMAAAKNTPSPSAAPPRLTLIVGQEELLVDRAVARITAALRSADP